MKIFEILSTNEVILKLRGTKTDFSKENNALVTIFNKFKKVLPFDPQMMPLINKIYKPGFENFETRIIDLIDSDIFDLENDPELNEYIKIAKIQLEHIRNLRDKLGI